MGGRLRPRTAPVKPQRTTQRGEGPAVIGLETVGRAGEEGAARRGGAPRGDQLAGMLADTAEKDAVRWKAGMPLTIASGRWPSGRVERSVTIVQSTPVM